MNMDRPSYTYLMILYLSVSIYGRPEGMVPTCEVGLMVRRGTVLRKAPRDRVTINCPVKHCGRSMNVMWCKILDTNVCEQIKITSNVIISQTGDRGRNKLVSSLTFKRISAKDGGQYRCHLKENGYHEISHTINISVSGTHQKAAQTHTAAKQSLTAPGVETESWLPYLLICASIALLVFTLSAITLLSSYCWKQILTQKSTKAKQMSTRMMPDLPKWSTPSTPVMFGLNNFHSPGTPPTVITSGNQPLGMYTTIDHTQAGRPVRNQHAASEGKKTEYAGVKVS
ncbi:uncharacterized protein [Paralichthys olivaceus]|uniref:uncharacterized protein n=1 Tax=Paralichthys olivaceus TaxID=8255 RepID=UPI0037529E35